MTSVRARVARLLCGCVACACMAGCALTGLLHEAPHGPGTARAPTGEPVAPQAALETIAVGRSTKADVASALGPAIVVPFDSGYEVWVYRWPGADRTTRSATEVVVLFEPSGRVKKARLRPGYPPRKSRDGR